MYWNHPSKKTGEPRAVVHQGARRQDSQIFQKRQRIISTILQWRNTRGMTLHQPRKWIRKSWKRACHYKSGNIWPKSKSVSHTFPRKMLAWSSVMILIMRITRFKISSISLDRLARHASKNQIWLTINNKFGNRQFMESAIRWRTRLEQLIRSLSQSKSKSSKLKLPNKNKLIWRPQWQQ